MERTLEQAAAALREAIAAASRGLVERRGLVELVGLAAVAGEHMLVVGPPGTAKSEAVRRIASALGERYFEYLLGRFTEPSELFGPVDLNKLKQGSVETDVTGMLPEAEIAFLDEIFLGSTAILNTLLGILNERRFRRGRTPLVCPLRVCVAATNTLPDDEALAAFADRFLVRVFIAPIADPFLEELLEGGWTLGQVAAPAPAARGDLEVVARAARSCDVAAVRPHLARAIRLLREAGVALTDRRLVKLQQLIAAAAALAGRTRATEADLWPIIVAVPTAEGQAQAREVLADLLAAADNAATPFAAAEASQGPLARARLLEGAGARLLANRPEPEPEPSDGDPALRSWRLALEGLARDIDAGFSADQLPPGLVTLRAELSALLSPP